MTEEVKEVDDKGVPLANRFKELERKIEDKYAKDLEQTRKELAELKNQRQLEKTAPSNFVEKNDPQEKLQRFVADPDAYIEQKVQERDFQRQVPQAEEWLMNQKGYSKEARARIDTIIFENKLNTQNHFPMERARIAWKLYESEANAQTRESKADEERREAVAKQTAGEGRGRNAPKQSVDTHNELIKRLAKAEKSGDMDESIKIMDMLQDHPMENSVVRGM